eukprot:7167792-Prymnesium_polylepis.2
MSLRACGRRDAARCTRRMAARAQRVAGGGRRAACGAHRDDLLLGVRELGERARDAEGHLDRLGLAARRHRVWAGRRVEQRAAHALGKRRDR